jgi:hypothetical protein
LGKRIFTDLWELRRKRDFKYVMGAKGRTRFLESNLSLCLIVFMSDFGAKGMGAQSQCSSIISTRPMGS